MRAAVLYGLLSVVLFLACDSKSDGRAPTPQAPSSPPPKQELITDRIAYAKQLLADAGYPGGKGLGTIEVLYNTDEGHKKIAAAIQQMWNKNLGVKVELRNSEWKVYLDDLSKLRYQVARRGWIGDYRDPYTFIELMKSTSMNNNTGWVEPEFDRLVKESGNEPDAAKRYEILRQAEVILVRDVPVIPLYYYVSQAAWTDQVKGVYQNIMDYHPLNEAYVEGKDTIIINNGTEIQALDPSLARGVPEHRVLNAVYEGLTRNDPKTYDPLPGVAEKWDVSPDGKTLYFMSKRPGGYGESDIYVSRKQPNGEWTKAENLGPNVNSKYFDHCFMPSGVPGEENVAVFASIRPREPGAAPSADFYTTRLEKGIWQPAKRIESKLLDSIGFKCRLVSVAKDGLALGVVSVHDFGKFHKMLFVLRK